MKFSICQLPNGLSPNHPAWFDLLSRIEQQRPDVAVLNEMPFGGWLAKKNKLESDLASASVYAHECALSALHELPSAVIGSRPICGPQKLSNEAFLLADGIYTPVHHKHYFPQEPGFYEDTWFAPQRPGFDVVDFRGLKIGVLLCTELMFTEWARHYRRQGAHVLVAPRASGTSMHFWDTAAAMAAIVSGCYVLSSNRVSVTGDVDPCFGGRGFAYSPTGQLIAETSSSIPLVCIDIDLARVTDAQQNYPCYVRELKSNSAIVS
ncbi:carbon-nitrogen hydrolase family protein [Pseudolysobacter antarcticus]|uniref:Carbon-nitrogen hydrolase family protein n=1 Tax=Pseudolysobacter antarcticus TaxID=2511995 RepID=A0A411HLA8_9GAMM|nr:carbon-nitrogen hydrolase family protein [Pseudolysobacter antarcticus]QBB71194.1 carbon-nitrogen hydrolase family protein [Pseudolysobacter antarcticus]